MINDTWTLVHLYLEQKKNPFELFKREREGAS